MGWQKVATKADKFLGKKIEEIRLRKDITRLQLGKKINVTFQQIEKYENGTDRIPVDVLEEIAEALDMPIPKKIIRRIVFSRKLEAEKKEEREELIDLYEEALSEDDDE